MPKPNRVFVLMLENRSFDHMFGFAGLRGVDQDGNDTTADGQAPSAGVAPFAVPADPPHEFDDVLMQLTNQGTYTAPYPAIDNAGFEKAFADELPDADSKLVLQGYKPEQLPVLHQLAAEFAICDRWFSSLPGPTWPNRMFIHGASSGGLDHSPSNEEIVDWEFSNYRLPKGNVFEKLDEKGVPYRIYSGDDFPMIGALKHINLLWTHHVKDLAADLQKPDFAPRYVFIEPSYAILNDYRASSCMHPLADVRDGEALVKQVYEAIRNSPFWEESVLIITWDEHGGFYDHVPPPSAIAPGDEPPFSKYNDNQFTFEQLGVRVPALVISPHVVKGTIDHRQYDHSSIPKALGGVLGFGPLTKRDANAKDPLALLTLSTPRTDTPATLRDPVANARLGVLDAVVGFDRAESVDGGSLPAFIHAALRQHVALEPGSEPQIRAEVEAIQTRGQALDYIAKVKALLRERAVH